MGALWEGKGEGRDQSIMLRPSQNRDSRNEGPGLETLVVLEEGWVAPCLGGAVAGAVLSIAGC